MAVEPLKVVKEAASWGLGASIFAWALNVARASAFLAPIFPYVSAIGIPAALIAGTLSVIKQM